MIKFFPYNIYLIINFYQSNLYAITDKILYYNNNQKESNVNNFRCIKNHNPDNLKNISDNNQHNNCFGPNYFQNYQYLNNSKSAITFHKIDNIFVLNTYNIICNTG